MTTAKQIGAIYGLGTKCGLYEKGNPRDNLHNFVWQLTQKLRISELTTDEAVRVIRHLKDYHRTMTTDPNEPVPPDGAGGLTTKQQIAKAFGLTYELQGLDTEPSAATAKQRLAGVMHKVLGVTVDLRGDIFKGITFEQGDKIIEQLKRYVRSAKRRRKTKTEGVS
ncbi:MAG: regulatory protein GemA [Oscillospiraceae bacterium]|nr:regulatory protein GemA [Oscillospiraceae bacterium]